MKFAQNDAEKAAETAALLKGAAAFGVYENRGALHGLKYMIKFPKRYYLVPAIAYLAARGIKAQVVGQRAMYVQFRNDVMGDVKAVVKKFKGIISPAPSDTDASMGWQFAQSDAEKAAETAALLKGHQKQIEKLKQRESEARRRGAHDEADAYRKRYMQHEKSVEQLGGPKARTQQSRTQQRYQQERYRNAEAWTKSQARRRKVMNLTFWGLILAPYLIRLGIHVYKKGKDWFAEPKNAAEEQEVKEALNKAKKKRASASMGWKTDVWTTLGIVAGATSAPPGTPGTARILTAAIGGLAAYLQARGVESIFDPRTNTIKVPTEQTETAKKLLAKKNVKVKELNKTPAASMGPINVIAPAAATFLITFGITYGLAKLAQALYERKLKKQLQSMGFEIVSWPTAAKPDLILRSDKPAKDDVDFVKNMFAAMGIKTQLERVKKVQSAGAAFSHMMRRHQRRVDAYMSDDMEDGFSKVIQVRGDEQVAKVLKAAKDAGFGAKLYNEDRIVIIGPRDAVTSFIQLLSWKLDGQILLPDEDRALAHDLSEAIREEPTGTRRHAQLCLAHSDVTSLHGVPEARKARYRAMIKRC